MNIIQFYEIHNLSKFYVPILQCKQILFKVTYLELYRILSIKNYKYFSTFLVITKTHSNTYKYHSKPVYIYESYTQNLMNSKTN